MEHFIAISIILIFEYIGDFVLQSREVAENKSKDLKVLSKHILILSGLVFLGSSIAFLLCGNTFGGSLILASLFTLTNGLIHAIIDMNIWKGYEFIVKRRFEKNGPELFESRIKYFKENKEFADDPMFYNFIGFDRLLHILTILGLYFLLRG